MEVSKSDWKLFRTRIGDWQEAYMERLVKEGKTNMRPYKRLTIICGMISFFSLAICLFLHYFFICDESEFWINVCRTNRATFIISE